MSRARQIADMLDANGDVKSSALDNVPASNDASALTTGTLDAARIAAGSLPTAKISGLHAVATSGAYADVSGTPSLHAVATSGAYADVTGTPSLHAVATSGNYNNLSNLPSLFDGNYNNLSNKPSLFNGSYTSLTNRPTNNIRAGDQRHATTGSNRALTSGTFVNHISVSAYTVPSGFQALCIMSMSLSSMYESSSGGPKFRFHISGPNNWYSPEHRGGRGSFNNYTSSEGFVYFQHGFNPGSHTVYLQAGLWQGSNVTLNEDGGYDTLTAIWIPYQT